MTEPLRIKRLDSPLAGLQGGGGPGGGENTPAAPPEPPTAPAAPPPPAPLELLGVRIPADLAAELRDTARVVREDLGLRERELPLQVVVAAILDAALHAGEVAATVRRYQAVQLQRQAARLAP